MVLITSAQSNASYFPAAASNDSILQAADFTSILVGTIGNAETLRVTGSNVTVTGTLTASTYAGLPNASASVPGIATLSSASNSASTTAAATSAVVAGLYNVVDVSTANQTLLKHGATHVTVRGDTNNVGVNCVPDVLYALDVAGPIRGSNLVVTGDITAATINGVSAATLLSGGGGATVVLSSASNDTSVLTAPTSALVTGLYNVVDVATVNQTLLKSGTSHVTVRGDTNNVGVNCVPGAGWVLDVAGPIRGSNITVTGAVAATSYTGLPAASTSVAGIVTLSADTTSGSIVTAPTSAIVRDLYNAVDVATTSQTKVKNGSTYIAVRSDTNNVGINCVPAAGYALDVVGAFRTSGQVQGSSYAGLPAASTSVAGIVTLSGASNSASVVTAPTSALVTGLYDVVDVATASQSLFKNGATYIAVRSDTNNVGINCIPAAANALEVTGKVKATSLSATTYTGLPAATTSVAGIVQLSSSTNSGSTTTAATSSAVAALYPISLAVNVATANQTLVQSGLTYMSVRGDTSNVGINCTPNALYALDVAGPIRGSNITVTGVVTGTSFAGAVAGTSYTGLPTATTSVAGIVALSGASNSASVTTAPTSALVTGLYNVVDVATTSQTKIQNGTTYIAVRNDTTNVGINCVPAAGWALDVAGPIRGSNITVTGAVAGASYTGLPAASTSVAGIVTLSGASNSASVTTAPTSALVTGLYNVVDVATANQTKVQSGAAYISVRSDTTNVGINCVPTTGFALDVTGAIRASGDITAFSDIRYKYDLVKVPDAMTKVEQLNGYTFKRIDDTEENKENNKRYLGVVAQEVLAVLPEAVQGDEARGLSVAYGNLSALLIEAIKDLSARVKALEAK